MTYLKTILDMKGAPVWILDADITGFFDNINHKWILNNIKTIDPKTLAEWLKAGVLEGKAGINKSTQGVTPRRDNISDHSQYDP
jgi:RNA-directed DNA polymerase